MKKIIFICLLLLAGCTTDNIHESPQKTSSDQSAVEYEKLVSEVIANHPHGELLSSDFLEMSIEEIITQTAKEYNISPESYHVAYTDLDTQFTYDYREKEIVFAASTTKIGIAALIIDGIEENLWDYSTEIYYDPVYYEEGAGEVTEGPDGVYYEIEYLLEQMIVESDNTATNLLLFFYQNKTGKNPRRELTNKVNVAPFPDEMYEQNLTTAQILELFLQLILREEKYSPIVNWMKETERGEFFKEYIQSEMATKHGINSFAHHDIGVLFDGQTPLYTLVILTDGSQPQSDEFMATVNLRLSFRKHMKLAQ